VVFGYECDDSFFRGAVDFNALFILLIILYIYISMAWYFVVFTLSFDQAIMSSDHFMLRMMPSPSCKIVVRRLDMKPFSFKTSYSKIKQNETVRLKFWKHSKFTFVSPVTKLNERAKLGSNSTLLIGRLNSTT